jgi:formylmethanofuran dehydrogenase subunit D
LSTETQSSVKINVKNTVKNKVQYNTIRHKQRDSFYHPNGLWRIDLTKVNTQVSGQPSIETYEIECEYTGDTVASFNKFIHSMSDVYKLVLFNTGYC